MTENIVTKMFTSGCWGYLALYFVLLAVHWGLLLQLGFRLLGVQVKINKAWVGIFIGFIYALSGQFFIPRSLFGLLSTLIIAVLLYRYARSSFIKALWAALFVQLCTGVTMIFLLTVSPVSPKEIFTNNVGLIIIGLGEIFGPVLALILMTKLKVDLFSRVNKRNTRSDYLIFLTFTALYLAIHTFATGVMGFFFFPLETAFKIFGIEVIVIAVLVMISFMVYREKQKLQEQEILLHQTEKLRQENEELRRQLELGRKTLETFESEQREFRDQLQIINLIASSTKNEKISNQIRRFAAEMDDLYQIPIEDPILASVIITQRIRAKEQRIRIYLISNTSLLHPPISPIMLGEIIDKTLTLFVENEVKSKNKLGIVYMYVKEKDLECQIEFCNSGEAIAHLKKNRLLESGQLEQLAKLEALITAGNGKFVFGTLSGYIVSLKMTFPIVKQRAESQTLRMKP